MSNTFFWQSFLTVCLFGCVLLVFRLYLCLPSPLLLHIWRILEASLIDEMKIYKWSKINYSEVNFQYILIYIYSRMPCWMQEWCMNTRRTNCFEVIVGLGVYVNLYRQCWYKFMHCSGIWNINQTAWYRIKINWL